MQDTNRLIITGYVPFILKSFIFIKETVFDIIALLILALGAYISIGVGVWLSIIYPYVYAQNKIKKVNMEVEYSWVKR